MNTFKIGTTIIIFCTTLLALAQEEYMLSPVPPYDTLYKYERRAASAYNLSGWVKTYSDEFMPSKVSLINKSNATEYSVNTTYQNNAFSFTNIPEGNYILRAIPASSFYRTTYYLETEVQAFAYVFNLNIDISEVQLYLKEGFITQADQKENISHLSIYPNPFKDVLTINQSVSDKIKILDSQGQLLHVSSEDHQTLNTSDWKQGIYFIKLENGTVQKCIKE